MIRRLTKYFIILVLIIAVFEGLSFLHSILGANNFSKFDGIDSLTIWAAVLTLVFLVFSVLGLLNIDSRIRNLHEAENRIEDTEREMKSLLESVKLSAAEERQKIVDKAEKEIVKIMDKSAIRQNNFDILTQIQNNPDPEYRIKRYTEFLNDKSHLEGVNLAFVYTQRGVAKQDLKRLDEAEKDYLEAMRLFPDDFDSYLAMGTLYAKEKQEYEKAIEYYLKAVKAKPSLAVGYEMIGNAYSKLGNFDKAEEYYSKANDCGLELAEWYYNKALKLRASGEDPSGKICESFYKRCLKLNPVFMPAVLNLAMTYRDMNKPEDAYKVLSTTVEGAYTTEFKNVILQRGILSYQKGRLYEALNDFNWVLTYDPNNIQNLTNLSTINLKMGNFPAAEHLAKRGLELGKIHNNHDGDPAFIAVIQEVDRFKASIYNGNNAKPDSAERYGTQASNP